ncbi:MAG TPA: SPOR domain-containing protein [Pseudidiomarina sp.]|nr:SPOR domain-containing protein [Pseudidiomarina sp.]
MSSPLQNRIVGSIILLALAVIILPELLDGKPVEDREAFVAMPLQPDVEVERQPVAEIPTQPEPTDEQVFNEIPAVETVELDEQTPTLNAESSVRAQPAAPTDTDLKEAGWIIQLAVLGNEQSAQRTVQLLQERGYPAYIEPYESNGRAMHKILVGPGLVKNELTDQLDELRELTNLSGKVIRYQP